MISASVSATTRLSTGDVSASSACVRPRQKCSAIDKMWLSVCTVLPSVLTLCSTFAASARRASLRANRSSSSCLQAKETSATQAFAIPCPHSASMYE